MTTSVSQNKNKKIEEEFIKQRGKLFGFIKQRVKTDLDAEDILQDVFFQFILWYRDIEHVEKSTSWLFTVARNKITDWYRKKKNINFSEIEGANNSEKSFSFNAILADIKQTPDEELTKNIFWKTLEEGLNEIPEEQREIFIQHELEGKSFKELSKELNVGSNTLISRKRYAVVYLRKKLEQLYYELLY